MRDLAYILMFALLLGAPLTGQGTTWTSAALGQLVKEANNPAEIGEELVAEPTVNDLRTASEAGRFLEKELK